LISIVLYGRNDAHGYNLHRRAALSLNCLAEVLTAADDEIVFVDYNTPDELPTFIEALADTLTPRCLDLLRVLRVPAEVHRERFEPLTHLPAVEPVCRNAAVRRANPANRWLLSTNTDMILLPYEGASLSEVCADLADGFYGLPRFELPEWLWEQLPRSDPSRAMSELRELGPRLRLDEPTLNNEWVRFDAPGDFQLCLREDFVAIDGCDEAMVLGWHVDSNLSRRMFLRRGSIETLEDRVAGYHCNHSRTPTVYHGEARIENDFVRYGAAVQRAELSAQRETWGLADLALEEVAVDPATAERFTAALESAIPAARGVREASNVVDAGVVLTYDSGHVLPHVADSLAVSSRHTTVGYLGANPVLQGMLAQLVGELDRDCSLTLVTASDERSVEDLTAADLFVADFGFDSDVVSAASLHHGDGSEMPDTMKRLRSVVAGFERLVHHERARLQLGQHPRRFVLVNSATGYTDPYVLTQLDCSHATTHSRVRRATVKPTPTARLRATRNLSWGDRLRPPRQPLALRPGEVIEVAELADLRGFGRGWSLPDPTAIWTHGARSELLLACDAALARRYALAISFGRVGVGRGRSLNVGLVIDGTRVASRSFPGGTQTITWRVRIPAEAIAKGVFEVVLELEGPQSWLTDGRKLGLHVRSLGIERTGLRGHLDDVVGETRTVRARFARRLRTSA
jgi:hypothetical protein